MKTPLAVLVFLAGLQPLHGIRAAPVASLVVHSEKDLAAWRHKSNTRVSVTGGAAHGAKVLRFSVDADEFSYGWIHRRFPEADLRSARGIHGRYRAVSHASGRLDCHVILPGEGGPSYFRFELGSLAESHGEWVEFYAPFSAFRPERGPVRKFESGDLGPGVLLQFLASVSRGRAVDVDLDTIALLPEADTVHLARRVALQRDRGKLLPPSACGGRPHPRLLLTDDHLQAYRAKATAGGATQAAYDRVMALGRARAQHVDPDNPFPAVLAYSERSTLEGHARRGGFEGELHTAVGPLETMAAASLLGDDRDTGQVAARVATCMARQLTVHDPVIDEGFTYTRTLYVRALAFAYDWLWDLMSPAERRDVKTVLVGFIRDIHARSQRDGWGRRPLHRVWNWDPGLMGACGIAMLALEGETRLAEQAILFDCRRHLRDYLTLGIDADGCCHEGPNYIGYGIGCGVQFIEALRRQGRGDLFTATNYDLIPPWLIAETLPDGRRWNNLSDCGHGQSPWPVYSYACGRLAELVAGDPVRPGESIRARTLLQPLEFLQQFSEEPGERLLSYGALAELMGWAWARGPGRLDPVTFDGPRALGHVLFYRPCPATDDPQRYLPLAQHFRGRGLVVCRTGFGSNDWHLAIEAGPHAAGHDQSDKGTFTLRALGGDLAIDSGYGNDGDAQKSGSSYAHNVVLIDGQGQPMAYHNQSSGAVTGFHHSDLLDWIRIDAREAWGVRFDRDWTPMSTAPVVRADRTFLFVRPADGVPGYLVLWDDIVKDTEEHDYTWQWHIPADMSFSVREDRWVAEATGLSYPFLTTPIGHRAGRAAFTFHVGRDGRYRVYGLTRAGGMDRAKSDSFFVSVDGGERLVWDIPQAGGFAWSAVQGRGMPEPAEFALTRGEHELVLGTREPEAAWARWLILPADAAPPLVPDAAYDGRLSLGVADADMADAPFVVRQPEALQGDGVSMCVYPVSPRGSRVTTDWFVTSRENAHPRLSATVRAVEPHVVTVLVPGRDGRRQPRVSMVPCDGGRACRVDWGDTVDTVVFSRAEAKTESVALKGNVAFLRHAGGRLQAWGLLDGRSLSHGNRVLCESGERTVRVRCE